MKEQAQKQNKTGAGALCALALFAYAALMTWLHYKQITSPDALTIYTSDLVQHLVYARQGMIYSAVSLLIAPVYALGGSWGIAVLLAVLHLLALAVFAWGLRPFAPDLSRQARLMLALVVNLAQAVWVPHGGYWYQGTLTGTIYHNTTYIFLAPFALLTALAFYRVWQGFCSGHIVPRAFAVYTLLLTLATSFKANFIFAFAPTLLLLLIADFIRTRAKNIKNEVLLGCSVFPGVALCVIQAAVLFTDENSGLQPIFSVEVDRTAMLWGVLNRAAVLGLLRSLFFPAAVVLLLGQRARGHFSFRFSLLMFSVSMAEALLLVEGGERLYHFNLWWGPFVCYWVLWLELVGVLVQAARAWRGGERQAHLGLRVTVCALALAWHIASGVCFLALLLQGTSYNIPILP